MILLQKRIFRRMRISDAKINTILWNCKTYLKVISIFLRFFMKKHQNRPVHNPKRQINQATQYKLILRPNKKAEPKNQSVENTF